MLIDGLTVVAQIVNFLLLVWLLKRFLYGRILSAIDAREKGIAASLAEAAAREREAKEHLAAYQAKLQDFEREHASLLTEAKLEAEKRYAEMLEKAHEDIRVLETQWREELERERSTLLLDFRRRVANEILGLTRRTVEDLTCLDVQECAVRAFLDKTHMLGDDVKSGLSQGDLLIRAAFDLPEETRAQIRKALEVHLQAPVLLRFERAPGLGLGLELSGNGWRVGWNSNSYLEALSEELMEVLEHTAEPDVKAGVS
jgi:F-type H+-transporting ATPase subunit b